MADEADIANDYIDNEVSRALSVIRQKMAAKTAKVCKLCRRCGEKIPSARLKLGFQLCIGCAEETERRKSLFKDESYL